MLEGLIAARGHAAGGRRTFRINAGGPRLPVAAVEARDRRQERFPSPLCAGHNPRPARTEEPLVTASHEEVAAQIREDHVFDPKAVHAIDANEHAGGFIPARIDVAHRIRNRAQREFETSARMYPGERENTRGRGDGPGDATNDLLFRE